MRLMDLQRGWTVVGNDGRTFGTLEGVGEDFLHVIRSPFSADAYVPLTSVANVENETIYLNLSKSEAEEAGWEQPPRSPDERESSPDSERHRHV